MYWLVALMSLSVLGLIGLGLYLEFAPQRVGFASRRGLKTSLAANIAVFLAAEMGLLWLGTNEAMAAAEAASTGGGEVSLGFGLAMIGAALPTALATIAAGIAVGPVGAAALAVITEKPEVFGRSLIFLGLAEGIAIYGVVVTILMLDRI
jgi:V/A-type H+-transporting ATPase subunit K